MKKEKKVPLEVQKSRHKTWIETKYPLLLSKLPLRIQIVISNNDFKRCKEVNCSYLYGEIGTGKSSQAGWMFLEWNRIQYINRLKMDSAFITTIELLAQLKNTYNPKSEIHESDLIEYYKHVELLVLDDFGIEKTSEWAFQLLYLILCYRYDNFKTTIYTSNNPLNVLAEKLGDDRIPSRIEHECKGNIIQFKGKSKRT